MSSGQFYDGVIAITLPQRWRNLGVRRPDRSRPTAVSLSMTVLPDRLVRARPLAHLQVSPRGRYVPDDPRQADARAEPDDLRVATDAYSTIPDRTESAICALERCGRPAITLADHPRDGRTMQGSSISAVRIERTAHPVPPGHVSADQRGCVVSRAGSNCRPSANECGWSHRSSPERRAKNSLRACAHAGKDQAKWTSSHIRTGQLSRRNPRLRAGLRPQTRRSRVKL